MKILGVFLIFWGLAEGSAAAAQDPACPPGALKGRAAQLRQSDAPLPPVFAKAIERIQARAEGTWRADRATAEAAEETFRDYHRAGWKKPPDVDDGHQTPLRVRHEKESRAIEGGPGLLGRRWKKGKFVERAEASVEVEYGRETHQLVLKPIGKGEYHGQVRLGGSRNPIYEFEVHEGGRKARKVFRPIDAPERGLDESRWIVIHAARGNLVAGKLNEAMRLGTSPRTRIARVNGQLGIVTDFAPGVQAERSWSARFADPKSAANAQGFEFWIGQGDGNNTNVNVTRSVPGGAGPQITVYDYNGALTPGLNFYAGGVKHRLGHILPERYTRQFIAELREMNSERIRELVGDYVTDVELEGLNLRRDVVLKDVELKLARGEPAFLD